MSTKMSSCMFGISERRMEVYSESNRLEKDSTKRADIMNSLDYMSQCLQQTRRSGNRQKTKCAYKHVPHRDKPHHLVARRNARERRRVQAVNSAFVKLRKHIPYENKHKRLSKMKTLHVAIDYIRQLQRMIQEYDNNLIQRHGYLQNNSESVRDNNDIATKENHLQWLAATNNTVSMTNPRSTCCYQANLTTFPF